MVRFFHEIELGDEIDPIETTITNDQVKFFQSTWGQGSALLTGSGFTIEEDKPSRFTSDEVAISEGLDGAVVPGIMHMGFVARLVTDWIPTAKIIHLDVIWRQFVPHNKVLTIGGIVTDMKEEDGKGICEADLTLDSEIGRHVTGKVTFSVDVE